MEAHFKSNTTVPWGKQCSTNSAAICSGRAIPPLASTRITRSPSPSRARPTSAWCSEHRVHQRSQVAIVRGIGIAALEIGIELRVDGHDVIAGRGQHARRNVGIGAAHGVHDDSLWRPRVLFGHGRQHGLVRIG